MFNDGQEIIELPVNIMFFSGAAELYGQDTGPAQATNDSAGFDLRAVLPQGEVTIAPDERYAVQTGIALEPTLPGVAAFVFSRSGLGAVKGLTVAQGVGIIDPDYRGEICVYLLNTGQNAQVVRHGDRIAQMVFMPFLKPRFAVKDALGETKRGAGGFGHTGRV